MKTSLKYIAQQIKGGTIENFIGAEDKEFLFGKQPKGKRTVPESRKTYVISRKALDILANISKKSCLPKGCVKYGR